MDQRLEHAPLSRRTLPRGSEPPLRAGMTATVSIDTKRERKLANLLEVFSTAKASRDLAPFENQ